MKKPGEGEHLLSGSNEHDSGVFSHEVLSNLLGGENEYFASKLLNDAEKYLGYIPECISGLTEDFMRIQTDVFELDNPGIYDSSTRKIIDGNNDDIINALVYSLETYNCIQEEIYQEEYGRNRPEKLYIEDTKGNSVTWRTYSESIPSNFTPQTDTLIFLGLLKKHMKKMAPKLWNQ